MLRVRCGPATAFLVTGSSLCEWRGRGWFDCGLLDEFFDDALFGRIHFALFNFALLCDFDGAACQADQCPDTSAHNDSPAT